MGFTNIFGGNAVKPAQVQYEALTFAADTTLFWPLETMEGVPYVAAAIDATATAAGLSLIMPSALNGATGVATLIANVGANTFSLKDSTGALIIAIPASQQWIVVLTDNSTAGGTWRAYQLGATTSNANAAALAGKGLEAVGSQLQVAISTQKLNVNTTLNANYRATGVVWTGVAGNLQLDAKSALTPGWWCLVSNQGSGSLTISTTGGDTLNGVASLLFPAGTAGEFYSAIIVCAADGFYAYSVPTVIPITGGGTGATNADDALENLGGTPVGISIFKAPNAAAILAILGITGTFLTMTTIGVDTAVTTGSSGTAYECSTGLSLSLPASSGVDNTFFFLVNAHGGDVTITPNGVDQINGQAGGTDYLLGQGGSLMMLTDGAGHWWPFLSGGAATAIPWSITAGAGTAYTATYTPTQTSLTDGLLLSFRANDYNHVINPTFQADGLPVRTITKMGGQPLVLGDIVQNGEYIVRYDLALTKFELLNPSSTEPYWVAAGGSADVITLTIPTLPAVVYDGLLVGFRSRATNVTTTPSISLNGTTARAITKHGGLALVAGDLPANSELLVRYNNAHTRWELLNPQSVASGATISTTTYTTAGSYTYNTPAGANTLVAEGAGGGGGGGGCAVPASTDVPGCGGGGGSGAWSKTAVSSPAATYAIVIGPGGAGGVAAAAGTAGSATTGVGMNLGGGGGGENSTNPVTADLMTIALGGTGGAVTVAGTLLSSTGQPGEYGSAQNNAFMSTGGSGASGPFGGGGQGSRQTTNGGTNGADATGPGAGGGGASAYSNSTAHNANGGSGKDGYAAITAYS